MSQGRSFCSVTAPQCCEKIAALAVDFIQDDSTVGRSQDGQAGTDEVDPHTQLLPSRDLDDSEST